MSQVGVSYDAINNLSTTNPITGTELMVLTQGVDDLSVTVQELKVFITSTFSRRISTNLVIGNEEVVFQRDAILNLNVCVDIQNGGEMLVL